MLNLFFDGKKLYFRFFCFTIASFDAVSGPHGNGKAPEGMYSVAKPVRLQTVSPAEGYTLQNEAYTLEGVAFWARIEPRFDTDRDGLGIHPDGNVPGTLGCIGVKKDVEHCFAFLVVFFNNANNLKLEVKYAN